MNDVQARLVLFSAIEGGHIFWSQERSANGAEYVYQKLKASGYDSIKYGNLVEKISSFNCDEGKEITVDGKVVFEVSSDMCGKTIKLSKYM